MTVGEFLEAVHDRIGDALQHASWTDGERVGILYARRDIDGSVVERSARRFYGEPAPDGERPDARSSGAGWPRTVRRTVDEVAANTYVPIAARHGLVVGVDPWAAATVSEILAEHAARMRAVGLTLRGGTDGRRGSKRCPNCGSTNYTVKSIRPGRPRKSSGEFTCQYCGEGFDKPVIAESRLAVMEDDHAR